MNIPFLVWAPLWLMLNTSEYMHECGGAYLLYDVYLNVVDNQDDVFINDYIEIRTIKGRRVQ